jgi:hypothetical protein
MVERDIFKLLLLVTVGAFIVWWRNPNFRSKPALKVVTFLLPILILILNSEFGSEGRIVAMILVIAVLIGGSYFYRKSLKAVIDSQKTNGK